MKAITSKERAFALALALTLLGAGCAGTGPNTQRGAVGGAALGALAGAVIGNNSGGNGLAGAAIGATAGAIAGGTLGNAADNQQGTLYTSRDQAATDVYVQEAPPQPAPRYEVVPAQPARAAVWVPGYWAYARRGNYVWVSGHWEVPPPNHRHFHPAHWERTPRGYVYVRGYWR